MSDRERLIELIEKTFAVQYAARGLLTAQHTADHLLANGVIVPPCKVGDTVYTNIIGTGLHNSFMVNSVDLLGFSNGIYSWTWHQLGKSVFLTIEEAEQALKECEQK